MTRAFQARSGPVFFRFPVCGIGFPIRRFGTHSILVWAGMSAIIVLMRPPGSAAAELSGSDLSAAILYRDRDSRMALTRIRSALASGDVNVALSLLQELFDAGIDSFDPTAPSPTSIHSAALTLLRQSSPAVQQQYRQVQEIPSRVLLQQAVASGDAAALGTVLRRYPTTPAAAQATNRLARRAFDHGDFGMAARLWTELDALPRQPNQPSPVPMAQFVAALQRSGQIAKASQQLREAEFQTVTVAGRPMTVAELFRSTGAVDPGVVPPSVSRPGTYASRLTPPAFPPVWHRPSTSPDRVLVELWTAARQAEGRPTATPAAAVLAGGKIFVREADAIVSFDQSSGRPAWKVSLPYFPAELDIPAGRRSLDIHELNRLEERYASNGVLSAVTTDGDRVYVVDQPSLSLSTVRTASLADSSGSSDRVVDRSSNRLLAFSVDASGAEPVHPDWSIGGRPEASTRSELAGHFIFGPPLVSDGRLYVITEHRQCLYLVSLEASTGEPLLRQPLGYVARPVEDDFLRGATALSPAIANGIAVCSTQAGYVVAVDLVNGRLAWAHVYNVPTIESTGRERRAAHRGDPSIPGGLLVRQHRAVILPPDSDEILCLDLVTGEVQWTAKRDESLTLACLTDESAILIGRFTVRAVSLDTGRTTWTAHTGAIAGTGVVTDSLFLLPLESGTVTGVNLSNGSRVSYDSPRAATNFEPLAEGNASDTDIAAWRPGNLITDGRSLYSVGPLGVLKLRTAAEALATTPPDNAVETARLYLAAGHLDRAERLLGEQLATSHESSSTARQETQRLLRELHYIRLEHGGDVPRTKSLAALNELSRTPRERGRFLLAATSGNTADFDAATLHRQLHELTTLDLDDALAHPGDPTHFVTPASWTPGLWQKLPDAEKAVAPHPAALATMSDEELRGELLQYFSDRTPTALHIEAARRAIEDGDFHRAETALLLATSEGPDDSPAETALRRLWTHCGIEIDDPLPDDAAPVASVQVRGRLWSNADADLRRTFAASRRSPISRARNPFRLVDLGDSRESLLAVVDLQQGRKVGEIAVDARIGFPAPDRQPAAGHFMPVAAVDRVYGLSYLEARRNRPVWEAEFEGHGIFLPHLGPYGPSFCSVATRSDLTVLDPATGETLWRRVELPAHHRFHRHQSTQLFGDEKALVLLDRDEGAYTVYQTQTGEELARGGIPISQLRQCQPIGRRYFFIETGPEISTARLWDPLTGRDELRFEFHGALETAMTRDHHLVLLASDGRLVVFDTQECRTIVSQTIAPDGARPRGLRTFCDDQRIYICLSGEIQQQANDDIRLKPFYDSPLPLTHVQGQLTALDRHDGSVAWSRPIEMRSFLDPVDYPLPILVSLARVSHRLDRRRDALLVEAFDPATGVSLGQQSGLIPDQILQARFDRASDRLALSGMTSTIELQVVRENLMDCPTLAGR